MSRLTSYLLLVTVVIYTVCIQRTLQSELHVQLKRALSRSSTQISNCVDKPECQSQPEICKTDADLAIVLCPSLCGGCVCEDNAATEGTCPQLVPDVCEGELAVSLCPKTCGLCDNTSLLCFDHVIGLSCSELPDPCNDPLGMVACPKFCGVCTNETTTTSTSTSTSTSTTTTTTTTTTPTTTTTSTTEKTTKPTTQAPGSNQGPCAFQPCLNNGVCNLDSSTALGYTCTCPAHYDGWVCQTKVTTTTNPPTSTLPTSSTGIVCQQTTTKDNVSCVPSEIVFMVEYAGSDTGRTVEHEINFIKELIDEWKIDDRDTRVGVVVYHDSVHEAINITDFDGNPDGLKHRLDRLQGQLKPSNRADLGKAFDFVRTHSFRGARPTAEKIVIPIVHEMSSSTKDNIIPAAQRLKDSCVTIIGLAVNGNYIDYDIVHKMLSQPYKSYYQWFSSYSNLESFARNLNWANASRC